jgi:hypothetical protein
MSKAVSANSSNLTKSRKQITKVLATGQKITLTPQDDRTLKVIYDYLAGYTKRKLIESLFDVRKREVELLKSAIPPGVKVLMKERGAGYKAQHGDDTIKLEDGNTNQEVDSVRVEIEKKVEDYYKAREVLLKLEERLKAFLLVDHKISFKDLDTVIRSLGKVLHRRQIEVSCIFCYFKIAFVTPYSIKHIFRDSQQMIWEVDENLDDMIDFDELQLTYYRNINDTTGSEPCFFFRLLEVQFC